MFNILLLVCDSPVGWLIFFGLSCLVPLGGIGREETFAVYFACIPIVVTGVAALVMNRRDNVNWVQVLVEFIVLMTLTVVALAVSWMISLFSDASFGYVFQIAALIEAFAMLYVLR